MQGSNPRGRLRRDPPVAREGQARAHLDPLETAFEKQEIVIGIITGRVKGGFTVEIDNVRAFLPGSLVDVRPVRDPSYLENKPLEFKVIKLDQKRNNVVVAARGGRQEYSAERSALLDNLQEGAAVKGVVKNLTDYGAFVDLGGIDGLLHITDMAWKRVKHPSEVVKVGEEIDVRILKFDRERSASPWA
jgi:small subunit ribosomal protein S1